MPNYQFTYDEVNLMRQWYGHIEDTAHPDYLKMQDVVLGKKLTRMCKQHEGNPKKHPDEIGRWLRVSRAPKLGETVVTFVKFNCYETAGGKFACQVLEGFGVHDNYKNKPALVVHPKPRYFRDMELRDMFIYQQKQIWGVK